MMGYAKHVGRVGALAVALGIGAAVATTPGVAWAEGPDEDPPTQDGGTPVGNPDTTDTSTPSTETQDPGEAIRKSIERAADELRDGIRKVVTGVVQSSGGAITSTHRNGSNPSNGNVPPVIIADEEGQPNNLEQRNDDEKSTSFAANNNTNPLGSFTTPRWRAPQAQVNTTPAPKPMAKTIDEVRDVVQQSINAVTGTRPRTNTKDVERKAFSSFDTSETEEQQEVRTGFVAPIAIMTNVINAALAPFLNPTPGQPAPQNPILWAVLSFVRRQVQDTPFGKIVLNPRPDISYDEGESVELPGAVVGFLNPRDRDLEPDGLDELTYEVDGLDEGASLDIDDTGAFLYTPPATWDGNSAYTDTLRVTVSDAESGPHFHGLAGLFSPSGGHTDAETFTIIVNALEATGPDPITGEVEVIVGTSSNPNLPSLDGRKVTSSAGEITLNITSNGDGTYNVAGTLLPSDAMRVQAARNQVSTFRALSAMRAMSLQAADAPEPVLREVTVEIEGEVFTFEAPILPARFKPDTPITVSTAPFHMVSSGDRLYVLSTPGVAGGTEPATISVIDTTTNEVVGDPIVLEHFGAYPTAMVANGDRVYIASQAMPTAENPNPPNKITVVDTQTNTELDPITLDGFATSLAVSDDRLYVGHRFGDIKVIDIKKAIRDTATSSDLRLSPPDSHSHMSQCTAILFTFRTLTYVSSFEGGTIHRFNLDAASGEFDYGDEIGTAVPVSEGIPGPPVVSPAYDEEGHSYVFVPHGAFPGSPGPGKITVIDTKDNSVETIEIASQPLNIAFSPDGSLAYIGSTDTITVIDTANLTEVFTTVADVSPDGYPNYVAVSGDGKTIYVSDLLTVYDFDFNTGESDIQLGNTVSVISLTTGANTAAPVIDWNVNEEGIDPETGAVPVAVTVDDGDGDALTVFVADQPSHGSITITPLGGGNYTVTYTPDAQARLDAFDSLGPDEDTFVIVVSDGEKIDTKEVTVPISPAESAVTDSFSASEGTVYQRGIALVNGEVLGHRPPGGRVDW